MSKNTLNVSEKLLRGESLYSENGRYQLKLQDSDGHFVLYDLQYSDTEPKKALWWSKHKDKGGRKTAFVGMQPDGNLVQRDTHNEWMWQSETAGHGPSYLIVQNDGNVVIYKQDSSGDTWCTSTQLQYLVELKNAKIVGSGGLILENGLEFPAVFTSAESTTRVLPNGQLSFEFTNEPGRLIWSRGEFRGPVPDAAAMGGLDSNPKYATESGPSTTYVLKLTAIKLL